MSLKYKGQVQGIIYDNNDIGNVVNFCSELDGRSASRSEMMDLAGSVDLEPYKEELLRDYDGYEAEVYSEICFDEEDPDEFLEIKSIRFPFL